MGFATACAASAGLVDWAEESNDTFRLYTVKSFSRMCKMLQPGDIIYTSTSKAHHVAVVVNSYPQAGPGSYYMQNKYKRLSKRGKKIAVRDEEYACIEEGTVVKCLEVRGNWIRTSAGWIPGKDRYEKYIKKAK